MYDDEDVYDDEDTEPDVDTSPDDAKQAMFRAAAKVAGIAACVMAPACCSCTKDPVDGDTLPDENQPHVFIEQRDGTLNDPTFWQAEGDRDGGFICWGGMTVDSPEFARFIDALRTVGFTVTTVPTDDLYAIEVTV